MAAPVIAAAGTGAAAAEGTALTAASGNSFFAARLPAGDVKAAADLGQVADALRAAPEQRSEQRNAATETLDNTPSPGFGMRPGM